jgi:hypothetical protein
MVRPGGTVTGDAADIAFARDLGPIRAVTSAGHSVDRASASQRRLVAILPAEAPRSVRAERIQNLLLLSPSALSPSAGRSLRPMCGASTGRSRRRVVEDE